MLVTMDDIMCKATDSYGYYRCKKRRQVMKVKELLPLIDEFSEVSIVEDGEVVDWCKSRHDVNEIYHNKIIVNVSPYGSIMEIEVE